MRAHFAGGAVAAIDVFIQRAQYHIVERGGHLVCQLDWWNRNIADVLERDGNGAVSVKRDSAGQHFVEHDARGIQIAALGNG